MSLAQELSDLVKQAGDDVSRENREFQLLTGIYTHQMKDAASAGEDNCVLYIPKKFEHRFQRWVRDNGIDWQGHDGTYDPYRKVSVFGW